VGAVHPSPENGGGRSVKTGAPPWDSNLNVIAPVASPSGKNAEELKMTVDPEMDEITFVDSFVDLEGERAMSAEPWNSTQRLTYDINSLPRRESRSRRQMTPGYEIGTRYRPDISNEERSRHRYKSEALAIALRLEAWADDLRRQARYCDDGRRHRNRGVSEYDHGVVMYLRQFTQRLDVMDRQLAELWKFYAKSSTPETKLDGTEVTRQQTVPTARARESSANREQKLMPTRRRKKFFGDRLICWGCGMLGYIRRYCD